MKQLTVQTAKPYSIYIHQHLLSQSGVYIRKVSSCQKAAILTDDLVAPLYLEPVRQSLEEAGISCSVYIVPHGETSKSHEILLQVYDFLTQNQITRSDLLVALGGGVIGDLTGYAAATYLRGMDFVQIPTTFLAQIDSSVGGKTGINTRLGKNLVGAFHQPRLVLCDLSTLSTLSEEIYKDGIAEAIKYGMIKDSHLFSLLSSGALQEHLEEVIFRCIDIKREVVEADELDKGERMLLNFGHTVGHAVENYLHYSITHGKGVAIGMAVITKAAWKAGLCSAEIPSALEKALSVYHIPSSIDIDFDIACNACLTDKKRDQDTLHVILVTEIGKGSVVKMPAEELKPFVLKGVAP